VSSFEDNWIDEFHIWQLVWEEDRITIYVDDVFMNDVSLSSTINGSSNCEGQNPFQQPHFILLNLAIGGSQGGDPSATAFPNRYIVDYVRVWQRRKGLSSKTLNKNALNIYPNPTNDYVMISSNEVPTEVTLYSIDGNEVQTDSGTQSLDTKGLDSGYYIIRVKCRNGEYHTQSIVIEP
ncbi:MAG: T9SS type A sorting domain-containing protein, partial [Desulfobacterales bacterium]|nr:T9SS type A sorting domain-containing protein [Desulfobacterales bacterium]